VTIITHGMTILFTYRRRERKKTSYRYASASHRVGGSTRTPAGRLLDSEERDADSLGQIDTVSSILSTLHSVTDVADRDVRYIEKNTAVAHKSIDIDIRSQLGPALFGDLYPKYFICSHSTSYVKIVKESITVF